MKNLKITGNSNLNFTYEHVLSKTNFIIVFVYSFMKTKQFLINNSLFSKNFNEVLILVSECLLDNYK